MPIKRERFSDLLDTVYAAAGDPARWPDALVHAADYLGTIRGQVVYFAPGGLTGFDISGWPCPELDEIFWKHYTRNPWIIAMERMPLNAPVASNHVLERRTIQRTGFYADVCKPIGAEGAISASVSISAMDAGIGGFSFGLSERALDRTAESLSRFARILPHLTRALDTSIQIGRYADGSWQLAKALELMPSPALLLAASGRVTYANVSAEVLLRLNDGLSANRDGGLDLTAALPAETMALQRALAEALSVANGEGITLQGPLRLTRPSGRAPLLVLPVPLPPPAFAMWQLVESSRVLVLVIDPEMQPLSAAHAIQTAFELTATEARVAALVGGGLNGPQTAAALKISQETVKTHLARCFEKTGIHSQAGLARLIGMLPRSPIGTGPRLI